MFRKIIIISLKMRSILAILVIFSFISICFADISCEICTRVRCLGVDAKKCESEGGIFVPSDPRPPTCQCCPACLLSN